MTPLMLIALASAPQPIIAKLVDCQPRPWLMAYEAPQASERQKREKPRKAPAPRPCITLASA